MFWRTILAIVSLAAFLPLASAQRPVVVPPRPAARPPTARPGTNPAPRTKPPTPSKRILDRRRGKDGSKTPTTGTPSGGGSGVPGVPSKGPVRPDRITLKAAERRLRMRRSLMRSARTETWKGEAQVSIGKREIFRAALKVEIRRSRDGSIAQRFTYQRRGDLPSGTRLYRLGPKGVAKWWLYLPEAKTVSVTNGAARLAESAIRFADLTALDLTILRAKFLKKKVIGKKMHFVYLLNSSATADEPQVRVYLRSDNNLVSRLEFLSAAGVVKRQVLFTEPKSFGIQKRWTKVLVHDLDAGISTRIEFKGIHINPKISDLRFMSDHLGE